MEDRGSAYYEKYLSGDDQGMVELIRDYKDGLILYLNSITGNICEAEELVIDTWTDSALYVSWYRSFSLNFPDLFA